MSLLRYEFLPVAERELAEAMTYYDAAKPGLGSAFGAEFLHAIHLLVDIPFAGKVARLPTKMAYREYLLRRFPYRIIYRVEADVILIVAVVYQGRRTRLLAKPRAGRAGDLCLSRVVGNCVLTLFIVAGNEYEFNT